MGFRSHEIAKLPRRNEHHVNQLWYQAESLVQWQGTSRYVLDMYTEYVSSEWDFVGLALQRLHNSPYNSSAVRS
jgi:hypothetical protein